MIVNENHDVKASLSSTFCKAIKAIIISSVHEELK